MTALSLDIHQRQIQAFDLGIHVSSLTGVHGDTNEVGDKELEEVAGGVSGLSLALVLVANIPGVPGGGFNSCQKCITSTASESQIKQVWFIVQVLKLPTHSCLVSTVATSSH